MPKYIFIYLGYFLNTNITQLTMMNEEVARGRNKQNETQTAASSIPSTADGRLQHSEQMWISLLHDGVDVKVTCPPDFSPHTAPHSI